MRMQTGSSDEPTLTSSDGSGDQLSKAEAEVYDRQIRLWGLEAQQKLHTASAFLYGLSGVGAEIAKNLMLCGLRSLTLMDDKIVDEEDIDSNFLLANGSIGQNRAKSSYEKVQALNPMVKVEVVESSLKCIDPAFIPRFTLCCAM
ncbi:ThiF family protein [Cooperia oncophora]